MAPLRQPWQGLVASAVVIVLAWLAILPWSYAILGGVFADVMMAAIPFAGVVGTFWQAGQPRTIARLAQPVRGLAFLALTAAIAPVVYLALAATIGGGLGASPFLAFAIILSVVITFFLLVALDGWPFRLIRNPIVGGIALIVTAYVLTGLAVRALGFGFLTGTPHAGIDPSGPIPAWDGLVASVTSLAVLFGLLHFELWPLTLLARRLRQPVLGLVWTAIIAATGTGVYLLGTRVAGLSPDTFLVTVPVPFLFGTVVLLTMLQGSLTARLRAPWRGVVSVLVAAVLGTLLARVYVVMMPLLTPDVPAPTDAAGALDQHLWLATALLGVTFPLMAMYRDYFGLWPLAGLPDAVARRALEPSAAIDEASA